MENDNKKPVKPKNKGGRPTKLNKTFLEAAKEVVNEDIDAIILTDEELVLSINEKLKKKDQIDNRTFRRWKARQKDGKKLDARGESFVLLIKRALLAQKKTLFEKLQNDEKAWQRYAWIIERKFDDWNLRRFVDHSTKGRPLKQVVSFTVIAPKEEVEGENNNGDTDPSAT